MESWWKNWILNRSKSTFYRYLKFCPLISILYWHLVIHNFWWCWSYTINITLLLSFNSNYHENVIKLTYTPPNHPYRHIIQGVPKKMRLGFCLISWQPCIWFSNSFFFSRKNRSICKVEIFTKQNRILKQMNSFWDTLLNNKNYWSINKYFIYFFFQDNNILPKSRVCESCCNTLTTVHTLGHYHYFHCKSCNKKYSLRKNTFLYNANVSLRKFVLLIYIFITNCWSYNQIRVETDLTTSGETSKKIKKNLGISLIWIKSFFL